MGEAKRRGSFEERKAMAIERNAEIAERQRLVKNTKKQVMSSEERIRSKRAGILLSTAYGMAMANGTSMPGRKYQ